MGGIRLITERLGAIVSALTPKTDGASHPFRLAEDGTGYVRDLLEEPSRYPTRSFVVRSPDTMPMDDGEAGVPGGRLRTTLSIQVLYLLADMPVSTLLESMAEDCAAIIRATQVTPDWQTPTTGIISIVPGEQPTREPAEQDSSTGTKVLGHVLTIPLPIIYREAS